MSERRKREKRPLNPAFKLTGSLIVIGILFFLGIFAVRFCLGLFMVGDYVVSLPGIGPEVVYNPMEDDSEESEDPVYDSEFTFEVARADILVAGDMLVHMPIVRSAKSGSEYNFNYVFNYVRPYVSKADYAIVDLETTFAGTADGREYTGYPNFNTPDALANAVRLTGFDMMLTGNNHCYDYGTYGLKRTLQVIGDAGLHTLGTTANAEDAKYVVRDVGGIKIGMISYTYATIGEDRTRPTLNEHKTDSAASGLINVFDYKHLDLFYQEVEEHISGMKAAGADMILLNIHWGDEYKRSVNDKQKQIAQKMCDLGVDIIAGTHPHYVQPMELLSATTDPSRKTLCVYSLGTFLSNLRTDTSSVSTGHTEDSTMVTFSLVKYSNGDVAIDAVSLQPTWVLMRGSGNDRTFHILPLDYGVENWEQVYELSSKQLENAKASYNRTMELVGSKYKEVQSALANLKTAREESYGGVGVG